MSSSCHLLHSGSRDNVFESLSGSTVVSNSHSIEEFSTFSSLSNKKKNFATHCSGFCNLFLLNEMITFITGFLSYLLLYWYIYQEKKCF